ncbi:MAG: DNA repair protein RecN [Methylobacteriaceae bacterium]|nr:DNA repair protein RecN [Methylobacteriaceae bacterium]
MLVQLAIRDIVLIERLDLELGSGLTVLTGETGAGKSILLDAFSLALGARGDGSLVRHGQSQGQVTAVFDTPADHPVRTVLQDHELDADGDLILRRVQAADGRTRAYVNDAPVSAQALRSIGSALVEIHGQHDDRALVEPAVHRALLDAFGRLEAQVETVQAAYRAWRAVEADLAAEQARLEKARSEADYLRHAHAELSQLAPQISEETELANQRAAMMAVEKVAGDLREAHEAVAGEAAPGPALGAVLRRLERRASQAPHLIEPAARALNEALAAIDVAQVALDQALRQADFDPRELDRIEERLFALRGASRKHSVPVAELPALAQRFADELEALDAGDAQLAKLAADVAARRAAYEAAAEGLAAARRGAAAELDAAVNAELGPLKLERARFLTQIASNPAQPTSGGTDRVEFWVTTNPGTRPGPLTKVASGGELARFMLALKVVLADRGSAPTLVFDEIDTGVGGAVADAIGQRLDRLARRVQVLAVTHAPQVAARAMTHLRIAKEPAGEGERVATSVALLDPESRREEIARMLAGATITKEARAAARRLIEGV